MRTKPDYHLRVVILQARPTHLAPETGAVVRTRKDTGQRVIIRCRDRVELMVMAARATDGET